MDPGGELAGNILPAPDTINWCKWKVRKKQCSDNTEGIKIPGSMSGGRFWGLMGLSKVFKVWPHKSDTWELRDKNL